MLRPTEQVRPAFLELPRVNGVPELRWVGGAMMDAEQYDIEGWRIVDVELLDDGREVPIWQADARGLREYGRLLRERRERRIAAAALRRAEDASWRDHVDAFDDARPGGYR